MSAERNNSNHHSNELVLSNGITLGPDVAAGLQAEVLRYNIKQAKYEKNPEKEVYLRHLLKSKINVPSNNMLSKAGKFFNFRNIGYEIIYQQNKRDIGDVIKSLDAQFNTCNNNNEDEEEFQDEEQQFIQARSRERNQLGFASKTTSSLGSHRFTRPLSGREKTAESTDIQLQKSKKEAYLSTQCLQFKQDKQSHLLELNQSKNNQSNSPTSSFTRQGRDELNAISIKTLPDERSIHFAPSFTKIHKTPPSHTFLPVPTSKRREDVNTQPDCIIRGNLCEYQIRSITSQLKQYSKRITGGLERLNALEKRLTELRGEKFKKVDFQKVQLEIETIIEQKRAIGEDILDAQKAFIVVRKKFEEKVRKNIDKFELVQFNQHDHTPTDLHACNHVDFKTMISRKELFPPQNVEDLCERLYNNYEELDTQGYKGIYFERQIGRKQIQNDLKGPNLDDVKNQQFEQMAFTKTPCFVRMKTPPQPSKYLQGQMEYESKITETYELNWKRVIQGEQKLTGYHATPSLTKINGQMSRDSFASHQIRSVKMNENFTLKSDSRQARSNSPARHFQKGVVQATVQYRKSSNSPSQIR